MDRIDNRFLPEFNHDLGLVFGMQDGKVRILGRIPEKKNFRLEVGGNLKDDSLMETYHDCESEEDRIAWMWAYAICDHPTHAWYSESGNPDMVSNKRFTQQHWDKLPDGIKVLARSYAFQDNLHCAEDGVRRRKPWIKGR